MSSFVDSLNQAGAAFCGFSWAMLVQSSMLIVVMYGLDLLIRKRVRAVVRYGMWMLVLVKLVLPPTLSVPTGIGYWVTVSPPVVEKRVLARKPDPFVLTEPQTELVASRPASEFVTPAEPVASTSPVTKAERAIPASIVSPMTPTLTWEACVFSAWIAGVIAILGLLFQRLWFVRQLLARSRPADASWGDLLGACTEQAGLRDSVEVRVSETLLCPAACGLLRPKILVPKAIEHTLDQEQLKAILLHELVHIKRVDLWVNLAQTLLQVVYFYNPLVWLANAVIRMLREKAVDETVLTKLGQAEAGQYSSTLN